ncbi:MAG: hypothetical protein ACKVOR_00340 [Flavobacteriales bacterium]
MRQTILCCAMLLPSLFSIGQIGTDRLIKRFYATADIGPDVVTMSGEYDHDDSWYRPGVVLNNRLGIRFGYQGLMGVQLGLHNSVGRNGPRKDGSPPSPINSTFWRRTTVEFGFGFTFGASGQNVYELNLGYGNMKLNSKTDNDDWEHSGIALGVLRNNLSFYITEKFSFTWSLAIESLLLHQLDSPVISNPYGEPAFEMPDMTFFSTTFGVMYNFP